MIRPTARTGHPFCHRHRFLLFALFQLCLLRFNGKRSGDARADWLAILARYLNTPPPRAQKIGTALLFPHYYSRRNLIDPFPISIDFLITRNSSISRKLVFIINYKYASKGILVKLFYHEIYLYQFCLLTQILERLCRGSFGTHQRRTAK